MRFSTSVSLKESDIEILKTIPVYYQCRSAAIRKCIFAYQTIQKIESNETIMVAIEEIARDMNIYELDEALDELVLRYNNYQKILSLKELKV